MTKLLATLAAMAMAAISGCGGGRDYPSVEIADAPSATRSPGTTAGEGGSCITDPRRAPQACDGRKRRHYVMIRNELMLSE